jgi:tetratricopeptide (TPR) repeat protein
VREVVYESVLLRKRQAFHSQVGGWLEEVTHLSGREGEYAAVIGAHYQGAGEPQRAGGWYLRAAQRAAAQGAPREARRLFDRVLSLLPETDLESRWQALAGRSEALGILGETQARRQDDAALLALAGQMQDDDHLAEAYFQKGFHASTLGNERQAQQDYQQALLASRRAGNQGIELTVLALQALSLNRSGEMAAASQAVQQALQLSQGLEDGLAKTRALGNISIYYSEVGDLAKAIQQIEQLVEITRNMDFRLGRLVNLNNLGYNYILLGNYPAGLHALQTAMELADDMGARHESAFARMNLGLAYLLNQDCPQAKSVLEGALCELAAINDQFGLAAGYNYLGLVFEAQGDWGAARESFSQAHHLFEDNGMPSYALDALAGLARCEYALGNEVQSQAAAGKVWAHLRQGGGKGMEFPMRAYLSCADILPSVQSEDISEQVIRQGYTELMERADKISDPQQRTAFLENVAENAELVTKWKYLSSGGK